MTKDNNTIREIPVMKFGKYRGVRYDQLPFAYCRWILTQKFDDELMEYARKRLEANPSFRGEMDVTRHAIDSFSLRFLNEWDKKIGLASHIAMQAIDAFTNGKDISKNRHDDESIIKEHNGHKWVFNRDGDLKVLITIM